MIPSNPSPPFMWDAADYHRSSTAQLCWATELAGKLGLTGTELVLDVGCGDGKVTAEIARRVPRGGITGVDSSPEMIRFASDHFPPQQYPNLRFLQADARALPFLEEFDTVFSAAALHWILDQKAALSGMFHSLRPGGRLLIQMGGRGNAGQVFRVLDALTAESDWCPYFENFYFTFGFFNTDEYRERLEEAGFDVLRVDLTPRDVTFSSREDFAGWFRTSWLPWLARVPEERHADFINAMIEAFLVLYPAGADRLIHVRMVRLEAEARKPGR
jgi:trans-aconitate 2-methyltransferase